MGLPLLRAGPTRLRIALNLSEAVPVAGDKTIARAKERREDGNPVEPRNQVEGRHSAVNFINRV